MKVQWIKPHHRFAYFAGDVCELDDEKAGALVKAGYVCEVKESPEPEPEPEPEPAVEAATLLKAETATAKPTRRR